jgi:hypothetical protein
VASEFVEAVWTLFQQICPPFPLPADFLAILNFCPSTSRFVELVWTLVQEICPVTMAAGQRPIRN